MVGILFEFFPYVHYLTVAKKNKNVLSAGLCTRDCTYIHIMYSRVRCSFIFLFFVVILGKKKPLSYEIFDYVAATKC